MKGKIRFMAMFCFVFIISCDLSKQENGNQTHEVISFPNDGNYFKSYRIGKKIEGIDAIKPTMELLPFCSIKEDSVNGSVIIRKFYHLFDSFQIDIDTLKFDRKRQCYYQNKIKKSMELDWLEAHLHTYYYFDNKQYVFKYMPTENGLNLYVMYEKVYMSDKIIIHYAGKNKLLDNEFIVKNTNFENAITHFEKVKRDFIDCDFIELKPHSDSVCIFAPCFSDNRTYTLNKMGSIMMNGLYSEMIRYYFYQQGESLKDIQNCFYVTSLSPFFCTDLN